MEIEFFAVDGSYGCFLSITDFCKQFLDGG